MLSKLLNWNVRQERINLLRKRLVQIDDEFFNSLKNDDPPYLIKRYKEIINQLKKEITELGGRLP